MAADSLREREFRLYKDIRLRFRNVVKARDLIPYLTCLTQDDEDHVEAVLKEDGERAAASELLGRLRRRPNWQNVLQDALLNDDLKLHHLYEFIKQKQTEINIIIKPNMPKAPDCLDGHNCPGSPVFDEAVQVQSEEEVLSTFRSRVIPNEFILFLNCLTEDDEDRIITKQKNEGMLAAADELIRALKTRPYWREDFARALKNDECRLEDIYQQFCDASELGLQGQGHTPMASALQPVDEEMLDLSPSTRTVPVMSVEDHKSHVLLNIFKRLSGNATTPEDFGNVLNTLQYINGRLENILKGSIVLTISIECEKTLDSILAMYISGLLREVIERDLMAGDKLQEVREAAKLQGIVLDKLDLDVVINDVDIEFCRLHLHRYAEIVNPKNTLESMGQFKGANKLSLMSIRRFLTPVLQQMLDDPFVEERYDSLTSAFENISDADMMAAFIEWVYNALHKFIDSHEMKEELSIFGTELKVYIKDKGSHGHDHVYFEITRKGDTVCPDVSRTGLVDALVISSKNWENLMQTKMITFSKSKQKYYFSSLLLQEFLVYKSSFVHDMPCSGFYPVFVASDTFSDTEEFWMQVFSDSGPLCDRLEYTILHYNLWKKKDSEHRLDVVNRATLRFHHPEGESLDLSCSVLEVHARFLKILVQEKQIHSFRLSRGKENIFTIEFDETRTSESSFEICKNDLIVLNMQETMNIALILSIFGTSTVGVESKHEKRMTNFSCKICPNDSSRRISMKFGGASLKPNDIASVSSGLEKLYNLHSLDLTKTKTLPSVSYRQIMTSLRYCNITSLIISDNRLYDSSTSVPLGLVYLKQLENLEMERCSLGDEGMRKLADELKNIKQITEINLSENGITCDGIMQLSTVLMDKQNLRAVRVHLNPFGYEGALSLAILFQNLPLLEIVNLCGCKVTDRGFLRIIDSLELKNLKKINVRECKVSHRATKRFVKSMTRMKHLQHLDYGCNPIGGLLQEPQVGEQSARFHSLPEYDDFDDISKEFVDMLNANQHSWNHLSLWKCGLNRTTIFTSNKLRNLASLTDICLQDNGLENDAAINIGQLMEKHWLSLRYINLRQNNISDEGARSILKGISCNTKLEQVYLDRNMIGNVDTILDLYGVFCDEAMSSLTEFDVSYNYVTEDRRKQYELYHKIKERGNAKVKDSEGYSTFWLNSRQMKI